MYRRAFRRGLFASYSFLPLVEAEILNSSPYYLSPKLTPEYRHKVDRWRSIGLDPAIDRWRWGPRIAIAIDLYRHSDGDRYRLSIDRCGTLTVTIR
ncbi:hypothetical protein F5883DRAFT_566697 [Diaporthe sp. PMI_573]|nr:hypothetical protein F5883DRAFT_566697 [Diaporthaceae sp. PMI_573]